MDEPDIDMPAIGSLSIAPSPGAKLPTQEHFPTFSNPLPPASSEALFAGHPEIAPIPARVDAKVPLRITNSVIPGAGLGIITLQDVAAGDLLFTIDQPLCNVPFGEKRFCSQVCDNCYASGIAVCSPRNLLTVPRDEDILKHFPCSGCKVMHYCSKECYEEAWNHHHKYECKVLGRMDAIFATSGPEVVSRFWSSPTPATLRILCLHKENIISEAEWQEFQGFFRRANLQENDPRLLRELQRSNLVIKKETGSTLTSLEIANLLYYILKNTYQIRLPLLKGGTECFNPIADSVTLGGECCDPFMNLLNHNCVNNTYYVWNGHQARFRASKNIAAGEELTIDYTSSEAKGDYIRRHAEQMTKWGFHCHCDLCKRGQIDTTGALRDRVLALRGDCIDGDNIKVISPQRIEEIEKAIRDMRDAGYGYATHPMGQLHRLVMYGYYQHERMDDVFKTALKLYYVIDPVQYPPIPEMDRIDTLYHLTLAICMFIVLNPQTPWKKGLLSEYLRLRLQLVERVEKCFGRDSLIAAHEKKQFEDYTNQLNNKPLMERFLTEACSSGQRADFVRWVNGLLNGLVLLR